MELEEFKEHVFELAIPGRSLGAREVSSAASIASSFSALKSREWDQVLATAAEKGQPCLVSFQSDGWGVTTATSRSCVVAGVRRNRVGYVRSEYLLEVRILKTIDVSENISMAMQLPRLKLLASKAGACIFQSAVEAGPIVCSREVPGLSVVISWYLQDGLHAQGFISRMRGRHKVFHEILCSSDGDTAADEARRSAHDWTSGVRCVLHSASNAIRWGLIPYTSKESLKSVHVVMKSLTNSSASLLDEVLGYVRARTRFTRGFVDAEAVRMFWLSLGLPERFVGEALALDILFDPDSEELRVHRDVQHMPDWDKRLQQFIWLCLRWKFFSDTRWGEVGPCLRLFGLSMACGIEYLVRSQRKNSESDHTNIGGFDRLADPLVREYCAVGLFSSLPIEKQMLELLEDDRFLLRASELRRLQTDTVVWVHAVPTYVWESLAKLFFRGRIKAKTYQHMVGKALDSTVGYLYREAYKLLEEGLLFYTQGDIREKLRALERHEGPIDDPDIMKVWTCIRIHGVEYVYRCFLLMRDGPCSTMLSEKGHCAGAKCHQHHKLYGSKLLKVRAQVYAAAPLLRPSKKQCLMDHFYQRREKLEAPVRYSAWNLYIAMLTDQYAAADPGVPDRQLHVQRAMKNAATSYHTLSAGELARLVDESDGIRRQRQDQRDELKRRIDVELVALKQEMDDAIVARRPGMPNSVDSCRLGVHDQLRVLEAYKELMKRPGRCLDEIDELPFSRAPLRETWMIINKHASPPVPPCPLVRPWWYHHVCQNMDRFADCALAEFDGAPDTFPDVLWVPSVVKQSPREITWSKCQARDEFAWILDRGSEDDHDHFQVFDICNVHVFGFAAMGFDEELDLIVIPNVIFRCGRLLVHSLWEPFEAFVAGHPLATPAETSRDSAEQRSARHRVWERVQAALPWLALADFEEAWDRIEAAEPEEEGQVVAHVPRPPQILAPDDDEDMAQAVVDILRAARALWEPGPDDERAAHFYWHLLGGNWCMQFMGVPYNRVQVDPRPHVQEFDRDYKWFAQKSFTIELFGGEDNAVNLARLVAHKASYFFERWVDDGEVFDDALAAYAEDYAIPADLQAWISDLPAEGACHTMVQRIARFIPRRR